MIEEQSSIGALLLTEVHVEHNSRLTVSEIANLWATYMQYSMTTCVLSYFERVVQDSQIKDVITDGFRQSETRVNFVNNLFKRENIPIPMGFTNRDVNLNAPALFSDSYILHYLRDLVRVSIVGRQTAIGRNCKLNFHETSKSATV